MSFGFNEFTKVQRLENMRNFSNELNQLFDLKESFNQLRYICILLLIINQDYYMHVPYFLLRDCSTKLPLIQKRFVAATSSSSRCLTSRLLY